jgi:hypothetical protein
MVHLARRLVLASSGAMIATALVFACGSEPAPDVVDASVASDAKVDVASAADADACPSVCGTPCPSFVPGPPHALVEAGVCTNQQIDGFRAACLDSLLDGGDGGACTPFRAANARCVACLATDPDGSAWGALLNRPGSTFYQANVAGCLAKTSGDASCAVSAENAWACPEYFCAKVCPQPIVEGDPTTLAAHLKCLADARKGFCSPWTGSACAPADAGATSACGGEEFSALYANIARVMCGVADAGDD